jgi:hypothetical protein
MASLPAVDEPIMFPLKGNWIDYMVSLDFLTKFVRFENQKLRRQWTVFPDEGGPHRVKLAAGHVTATAGAEVMVYEVRRLF